VKIRIPKTIGIAANRNKPELPQRLAELLKLLRRRKITALLDEQAADAACCPAEALAIREIGQRADLIIVLGGDGTILSVARELGGAKTPILGINLGNLGFLAGIRGQELAGAIRQVLRGQFEVHERFTIQTSILRNGRRLEAHRALNDVVISRGNISRIVRLRVLIDDQLLTEYVCDGMIFATPTGSTAYSLSAGGPILLPEARACIITPICPHALSNRPIVADAHSVMRCEIAGADGELLMTVDGQVEVRLQLGDEVEVRSSPKTVRLVNLKGQTYFDVLRQKLKWSGSNV
jgi:NAD+ kinase